MTKGTLKDKALALLRGVLKVPENASIDEIQARLETMRLDVETTIRLKEIEHEFRKIAAEHAHELELKGIELAHRQIDLLKADLASENKFRKYWRPTVAWILTIGLGTFVTVQVLVVPILILLNYVGVDLSTTKIVIEQLQNVSADVIIALIVPLLGLGAYRSYEKKNGVKDLPAPFS